MLWEHTLLLHSIAFKGCISGWPRTHVPLPPAANPTGVHHQGAVEAHSAPSANRHIKKTCNSDTAIKEALQEMGSTVSKIFNFQNSVSTDVMQS